MSREVRLATLPDGLPRPDHFELADVEPPAPKPGEVLVRNHFFTVFAALRTLPTDSSPISEISAGSAGWRPVASRSCPTVARRTSSRSG